MSPVSEATVEATGEAVLRGRLRAALAHFNPHLP